MSDPITDPAQTSSPRPSVIVSDRSPGAPVTPLGTIDAAAIGRVDRAGFVTMDSAGWGMDWWIGAEDRWHHPTNEITVRQTPMEDTPVVETAMRVPGGDIFHRSYGARGRAGEWDDSCVVVEFENQSSVPVALALVFQPRPGTGGSITTAAVDGDGRVTLDGRVVAVVSRPPLRLAAGSPGEAAEALATMTDREATPEVFTAEDGRLEFAVVVPLAHTARVKVVLPRVATEKKRSLMGRRRPVQSIPAAGEVDVPAADAVRGGWQLHTAGAARVELPEPALDAVVAGAQRSIALCFGDGFLDTPPCAPDSGVRAAQITEFLSRSGTVEPLGPLSRALVGAQRLSGTVRMADRSDAVTALLFAAAALLVDADELAVEDLLGPTAKAIHRIRREPALATPSSAAALRTLAPVLRSIGQPEVAEDALVAAGVVSGAAATARTVDAADGSTAQDAIDLRGVVAAGGDRARRQLLKQLVAMSRLGTSVSLADRYLDGDAVGTLGCDPAALAALANAVLDLAVRDSDGAIDVWAAWPERWWGLPAEAHAVRCSLGVVSHAVRWHGERPALLWEIEPGAGVDPDEVVPVLRSSGLDPTWQGSGWSGEALLSPMDAPTGIPGFVAPEPDEPADADSQPVVDDLAPGEGQSFS